jgi:hypothetical protein
LRSPQQTLSKKGEARFVQSREAFFATSLIKELMADYFAVIGVESNALSEVLNQKITCASLLANKNNLDCPRLKNK